MKENTPDCLAPEVACRCQHWFCVNFNNQLVFIVQHSDRPPPPTPSCSTATMRMLRARWWSCFQFSVQLQQYIEDFRYGSLYLKEPVALKVSVRERKMRLFLPRRKKLFNPKLKFDNFRLDNQIQHGFFIRSSVSCSSKSNIKDTCINDTTHCCTVSKDFTVKSSLKPDDKLE